MKTSGVFYIRLLKRPHKFFVYWMGQPNYHISDWFGCNYHLVKAEGQPKGGFDTPWDAWLWADRKTTEEIREEVQAKSGSHLSDYKEYYEWELIYNVDGSIKFVGTCPLDACPYDAHPKTPPKEWLEKFKEHRKEKAKYNLSRHALQQVRFGYTFAQVAKSCNNIHLAKTAQIRVTKRTVEMWVMAEAKRLSDGGDSVDMVASSLSLTEKEVKLYILLAGAIKMRAETGMTFSEISKVTGLPKARIADLLRSDKK